MPNKKTIKPNKCRLGFSLIEIVVIVAVFALGFMTMMQFYRIALVKSSLQQNQTQAAYLASAALEAVRQIRDRDWNNINSLNLNQDYALTKTGAPPNWNLNLGAETIDQFQRTIKFFNVNRDLNDNIVSSGGWLDTNTKKAVAAVSWQQIGQTHQVSLTTYLTNWQSY